MAAGAAGAYELVHYAELNSIIVLFLALFVEAFYIVASMMC